jgi:pyridoxal phosphate enzyme (YggS family)
MNLEFDEFKHRADAVQAEIAEACRRAGRAVSEVELLAVTKNHPVQAPEYAARLGLRAVGENRVQEGVSKRAECTARLEWELIGHLQSNKAKLAAQHFDRVQSVDSVKLLELLDKASASLGKTLPVLLQINAGRDPAKFGAEIEEGPALLERALSCRNLRLDGLMTIAPLSQDLDVARRCFATLRELRDDYARRSGLPLRTLSMGMSGDLGAAVLEGSTQIRVGTALFGARA